MTARLELDLMFDELTPLQQLALETLASRYRLGHQFWTFHTNQALTKTLNQLESLGLISVLSPIVESTKRAMLTELGKEMILLPDYVPPIMQCPTTCNRDSCAAACHEKHEPSWHRDHHPDECPAIRYLSFVRPA